MVEQLKYIPWRVLPTSHQNCFANCSSYISNPPWWCFPFLTNKKVGRSVRKLADQILRTENWDWNWQVFLFWKIWQGGKFESIDEKSIPHGVNQWLGYNLTFHFKEAFFRVQHDGFPAMFSCWGAKQKTVCIVVPWGKSESSKCFLVLGQLSQ